MVYEVSLVFGGVGGGVQRDREERRHAARYNPRRTSALQPELVALLCASGLAGAPSGVPATKALAQGSPGVAAPAAGGCTSRYSVFFASACFSLQGPVGGATDDSHAPSTSIWKAPRTRPVVFFSAQASGLRH